MDQFDDRAFTPSVMSLEEAYAQARLEAERLTRASQDPRHLVRLAETIEFLENLYRGRVSYATLSEVMSTSDFPQLYGEVITRQLSTTYNELPTIWANFARTGTVRDFRPATVLEFDGMDSPFDSEEFVKQELEGVREDNNLRSKTFTRSVTVYEKGIALNWRMFVNDEIDLIRAFPTRLARGAKRTENRLATKVYVTAAGPNSDIYNNTNKNLINTTNGASSNNPPLSYQGLRDAFHVMSLQLDADTGEPLFLEGAVLVIPPVLELTARELVKAANFEVNFTDAGEGGRFVTANWIGEKLRIVVDPYAQILNTTNGLTAWYIFANPSNQPALEVTKLRGYEEPMIFQKAPNTQRLGGAIDPLMGDFENSDLRYKAMLIRGSALVNPQATVASTGAGS